MKGFNRDLIAPCGMNCGICSGYLAYSRNIPRKRGKIVHCVGCRPRNKRCAFLKGYCARLRDGEIGFCFECIDFPCYRLSRLDRRYWEKFGMSMIENLNEIKKNGIDKFLENQREKYRCPKCGGVICIHNKKCFDCQKIESWKS
jgi:hypothetical protein